MGAASRLTVVNRNPFAYKPWNQERSYSAMFNILEADIVVMQETKIQRKDIQDEMVLIPGWDAYFSLPMYKRGYSGVAIFTRNAVCAPIRAEEGITGVLTAPKSSTSFRDLPSELQIGGYPTDVQLSDCFLDAGILDSEGRCLILEFPAFVLIGTYCPAARDESREEFRIGYLRALDARVRNLIRLGKSVFLTGDLNISLDETDSAHAEEQMRKLGVPIAELVSTPARRILNQMLVNGKVFGPRDEGRENPVMVDLCRKFHPTRDKMFTCWDQKINARPGNYGSRIDYVLCSEDMKDWFYESNIQEGLMGSDHCPVYAGLKNFVTCRDNSVNIKDIMSSGMFKNGVRVKEWSTKDLLPLSAKLLPEFDRRRNIKDMFQASSKIKKPKVLCHRPEIECSRRAEDLHPDLRNGGHESLEERSQDNFGSGLDNLDYIAPPSSTSLSKSKKRTNQISNSSLYPTKRNQVSALNTARDQRKPGRQQKTLTGFFKTEVTEKDHPSKKKLPSASDAELDAVIISPSASTPSESFARGEAEKKSPEASEISASAPSLPIDKESGEVSVAKESWSKLFSKRPAPRCDHDEPCICLVSKKPGMNQGRSFYICRMPLGPSGQKEKNSPWRCGTFIWRSDWNATTT
ncbi:hypothetical protein K3495_g5807 [Podosphaera aphanis]|nr:hypothetical protein K3495_g5807 [Podosphaera aphanis]